MVGLKFRNWTVLSPDIEPQRWVCKCRCGATRSLKERYLKQSRNIDRCKSCAKLNNTNRRTHGLSFNVFRMTTLTYNSWHAMLQRCTNPKHKSYKDYGGRGVTVFSEWYEFANFLKDMGERPPGRTLDRINNNGNYEPGNCRWARRSTQANNRRY